MIDTAIVDILLANKKVPERLNTMEEVLIDREPITQCSFDEHNRNFETRRKTTFQEKINCSRRKTLKTCLLVFPIVKFLRYYDIRKNLLNDVIAGIATGLYQIPLALAFGQLSSLRVENGLYASIWPVVLYSIFGANAQSSVGTVAVICMFSANVINRQTKEFRSLLNITTTDLEYVQEFATYKEDINNSIVMLCGVILLLLGVVRLENISYLLSDPFMRAFTSGTAIHIIVNQLPEILGIKEIQFESIFTVFNALRHVIQQMTNVHGQTLLVAIISVVILLVIKEFVNIRFRSTIRILLPAELFVFVLALIVSSATNLHKHVRTVGNITSSIPPPTLPSLTGCKSYILDCCILAVVIHSNNLGISKAFAKKHNYDINNNQEMIAHGICNFVGAFFRCIPTSVSPQRSMMLSLTKTRSTVSGLFIAVVMLVALVLGQYVFEHLPKATLCAIVIVGLKGLLMQISYVGKYWMVNRYEFTIWAFTFCGVIVFNLTYGFLLGLTISFLSVVVQNQLARGYRLEKTIEEKILVEHKKYKGSLEFSGIRIFRFQSNLYYANAEIFRNALYQKTVNPRKLLRYLNKQKKRRLKHTQTSEKDVENSRNDSMYRKAENEKPMLDVIIVSDMLHTILEDPITAQMSSFSNDSITSVTLNKQVSETKSAASISMELQPGDSQSELSANLSSQLSNASLTFARQESFHIGEILNCSLPSLASTFTNLTYEQEEEDPDDGQIYITSRKFQLMRKVHHIIVDLSNVNYIDITAAHTLRQISNEFNSVNIKLFLSGCSADVLKTMELAGVSDSIPQSNIFVHIYDALAIAKQFKRIYSYVETGEKF